MATFWGPGLRREDSAKLDAPTAAGGRPAAAAAPVPSEDSGSAATGVAATATGQQGDEPGVKSLTLVAEVEEERGEGAGGVQHQASGSGGEAEGGGGDGGGGGEDAGGAKARGALAKLRTKLRKKTSLRAIAKVASLRPKTLKAGSATRPYFSSC